MKLIITAFVMSFITSQLHAGNSNGRNELPYRPEGKVTVIGQMLSESIISPRPDLMPPVKSLAGMYRTRAPGSGIAVTLASVETCPNCGGTGVVSKR